MQVISPQWRNHMLILVIQAVSNITMVKFTSLSLTNQRWEELIKTASYNQFLASTFHLGSWFVNLLVASWTNGCRFKEIFTSQIAGSDWNQYGDGPYASAKFIYSRVQSFQSQVIFIDLTGWVDWRSHWFGSGQSKWNGYGFLRHHVHCWLCQ